MKVKNPLILQYIVRTCKNHFPQVVEQIKIEIDQSSTNMKLGLDTYFGLEEIGDYDCQM